MAYLELVTYHCAAARAAFGRCLAALPGGAACCARARGRQVTAPKAAADVEIGLERYRAECEEHAERVEEANPDGGYVRWYAEGGAR